MPSADDEQTDYLSGPHFVALLAAAGVLMALLAKYSPLGVQIAVLGSFVATLAGLVTALLRNQVQFRRVQQQFLESCRLPLALAPHHQHFDLYVKLTNSVTKLAAQTDPVLRELAHLKLTGFCEQLDALSAGHLVFYDTETWRTAYEKLLQTLTVQTYYSAAWVRNSQYWQDKAGLQSMQLNFTLIRRGYWIERTLILPERFWKDQNLPHEDVRRWIAEQHARGILLRLVREADLEAEPDLLADFGIYGDRAVGEQFLDLQSRTVRFHLSFDRHSLRAALDRWERLNLFAIDYVRILDQTQPS